MSKTIKIGGRLYSVEQGNVVAGANDILDDTKGKKQSVINSETDAELLRLDEAKQNVLTFDNAPIEDSNNPVKSGGVYAADAALQRAIEAILQLIPSAATALNQLADKAFVNSTVATNTATFRGTYNVVTDLSLHYNSTHQEIATALLSVVQTADNNDYCFVQIPVSDSSDDIRVTERYKFNGTSWEYEYDLNNSGFTADQWGAINSGITSVLVSKLGALPTAAELATLFNGKQNTLTFDNAPVAGSDNPVKSSGLYNAFAAINALIPDGADANNKLVAESRLVDYVTTLINALDATFDVTSADGHVTLRMTQADGVITSVQILTSDIASASALTTLAGRVSTAESDIDALQDAYAALTQSDVVIVEGALPSTGQQNIIYRQIDQDHTPPQFYSDYMWNGTTWVLMATYMNAIDPRPKKGSQNLVTSGGVFDNMGALDVSELNATENPHTLAIYADLSAALASIPSDYQKGGMSIKFVQSSDNKYVQCRLMAQNFTTDVTQWQVVDDEPTAGSENLVKSGGVHKKFLKVKKNLINTNCPDFLTDKEFTNTGAIVNTSSGVHKYLTGFIPVTPGEKLTASYDGVAPDRWASYWCCYDANKNFLRSFSAYAQESLGPITIPNDTYFIRANSFSGSYYDIDKWQIEKGTTATTYKPYTEVIKKGLVVNDSIEDDSISEGKILNQAVSNDKVKDNTLQVKKLGFTTTLNLINTNDPDFLTDKEILSNGGISSATSTHKRVTGYIPVTPGDTLNMSYDGVRPDRLPSYWNCYDANKQLIHTYSANDDISLQINGFIIPNDTYYIRLTSGIAESYSLDKWQLEKGATPSAYRPYELVIKVSAIADWEVVKLIDEEYIDLEGVVVAVPSTIYTVVGDTIQLFYRSMLRCIDPYKYNIIISTDCTVNDSGGHPVVKAYPRYIEITPTPAMAGSTYSLTISVTNNSNKVLASKLCSFKVSNVGTSPSSQKNILIVGDSTPRNGVMPDELQRRLIDSGGTPAGSSFSNIALVGRQIGTNPGSVAKCECGGGNFADYTALSSSNPFYHNGAIDMDWYVDEYCNGQVDIILTTLFANGSQPFAANVNTLISQMQTFISQCRNSTKLANVKFGIGLEFNYDLRGGLGYVYGSGPGWANWYGMTYTHCALVDALEKWIEDNNAQDYVFILNLLNEFDCENGYTQSMKKMNVRLPDEPVAGVVEVVKEPFGNNGVHPHEYGRKMFSDTCWRLIVSKFCQ